MIAINQLDQLIEYDRRLGGLELSSQNRNLIGYLNGQNDRRQVYEQQLLQLKDDIASSDINSEYKDKFLASINDYFANLNSNQSPSLADSNLIFSFLAGIFVGAIAKYGFDKTIASLKENFVEQFKTSFYDELSSLQKGVSDEHKQGQRV